MTRRNFLATAFGVPAAVVAVKAQNVDPIDPSRTAFVVSGTLKGTQDEIANGIFTVYPIGATVGIDPANGLYTELLDMLNRHVVLDLHVA